MNNIKSSFSIKDLENLSGIKAHTIRIWEKRYNVFEPLRTETNIRYYDLAALQKLLNITLLHDYGYKISKISKLSHDKLNDLVRNIISEKSAKNHAISSFKLSMMNFDQTLFFNTYDQLLSEKSFREVFYEVFLPLLTEIGFLWQSETISPAHEHFISFLIKQKILINTEKLQSKEPSNKDKVYVLYLPENEVHELGLMYLNYEILLKGYKTIYLGESVPLSCLIDVKKYFSDITFVCYTTVEPQKAELGNYIDEIKNTILTDESQFHFLGRMAENINIKSLTDSMRVFDSVLSFSENL
jgi:DNA-binding transcriptional MerR regulator